VRVPPPARPGRCTHARPPLVALVFLCLPPPYEHLVAGLALLRCTLRGSIALADSQSESSWSHRRLVWERTKVARVVGRHSAFAAPVMASLRTSRERYIAHYLGLASVCSSRLIQCDACQCRSFSSSSSSSSSSPSPSIWPPSLRGTFTTECWESFQSAGRLARPWLHPPALRVSGQCYRGATAATVRYECQFGAYPTLAY